MTPEQGLLLKNGDQVAILGDERYTAKVTVVVRLKNANLIQLKNKQGLTSLISTDKLGGWDLIEDTPMIKNIKEIHTEIAALKIRIRELEEKTTFKNGGLELELTEHGGLMINNGMNKPIIIGKEDLRQMLHWLNELNQSGS